MRSAAFESQRYATRLTTFASQAPVKLFEVDFQVYFSEMYVELPFELYGSQMSVERKSEPVLQPFAGVISKQRFDI